MSQSTQHHAPRKQTNNEQGSNKSWQPSHLRSTSPPFPPKKANDDEDWSNLFDGFLFIHGFFNFPISSNLSSVTFCGKRPFTFLQDDCDGKYDNALATFHPPKQCPASKAILGWIVQKNLNKNRFLPLHQILCLKASWIPLLVHWGGGCVGGWGYWVIIISLKPPPPPKKNCAKKSSI